MVRKVYWDENENELELFINGENQIVVSIKNDDKMIHIYLNYHDISELIEDLSYLHDQIK